MDAEPTDPTSRERALPDPLAVARAEKRPEQGPRIVFLSGGTALRGVSRALTRYTHRSVHVITPFDSGGSSAVLRDAFGMLAVGDLRNRLLALASDESARPLRRLLGKRLPMDETPEAPLDGRLAALAAGDDHWLADLEPAQRSGLAGRLDAFRARMPANFDLRGASLGNLVLAGGYLETGSIHTAIDQLAGLLSARGRVLPTTDADLHLAARLADGTETVGQHRLTGKEHAPLQSRIVDLQIVAASGEPAQPDALPEVLDAIGAADLVVYPMGSFYTSVLCNALPRGVGAAVAAGSCPKVYVPSTGRDPELLDTDLGRATELLVDALRRDAPDATAAELLDAVVLDLNPDVYPAPPAPGFLEALGTGRIETELVTSHSLPRIDSDRLAQVLVSLAASERGASVRDFLETR